GLLRLRIGALDHADGNIRYRYQMEGVDAGWIDNGTQPEIGYTRLAAGDYEVRLLRIPALYFVALWLKDEKGRDDILIPLDPAPAPFEPGRSYRPDEVLAELAASARTRLEFDDAEGSSSNSADQ
ncbi:MAG: triple tyrosine motif-containing protein, partial [Pseudonocardiaceae bacterium]